jgi:hypothetical protein
VCSSDLDFCYTRGEPVIYFVQCAGNLPFATIGGNRDKYLLLHTVKYSSRGELEPTGLYEMITAFSYRERSRRDSGVSLLE